MKLDCHNVFDVIRARAGKYPDRIAVQSEFLSLTFDDLIARAEALAEILQDRGAGPGHRVGIHIGRSPDLIVALLGVLGAGAAYVPLDPDYPQPRLRLIVEDSRISVLLGQADATALTDGTAISRIDPSEWPRTPRRRLTPSPNGENDPAYMIYTSGSTGGPKGVAIDHAALNNYLAWCLGALPATGGGVPLFASISFDHAVTCIYPPLLTGETLTLCPSIRRGRGLARALLTGKHYSFVKLTPSHLMQLNIEEQAELGRSADLVMLGGERSTFDHVRRLRRDNQALTVMNHYGPTEATVGCCTYLVPFVESEGPIPIGVAIPGMDFTVRGPENDICDIGAAGELFIAGVGLATEYWGRPDLTAAAFVTLPDGSGHRTRWYKSGDLAIRRSDGVLEYLGRIDSQIKILGHRIEPAEIEAELRLHPEVRNACVFATERPSGTELTAAIETGAKPDEASMREFLRERLPAVMIPARFLFFDRLPITENGKVDVPALKRHTVSAPLTQANAASRLGDSADIESRMLERWREVLTAPALGLDDDFFELGGDSIATVQIVSWVAENLHVNLEPTVLFEHFTVRRLAAAIRSGGTPPDRIAASQPSIPGPACPPPSNRRLLDGGMIAYRTEGSLPPIIVLGIGSETRNSLMRLDSDRPIFAIPLPGPEILGNELTAAKFAAYNVSCIEQSGLKGPYILFGWCRFGVLAFATAEKLAELGEEVEAIIMVDSIYPGVRTFPWQCKRVLRRMRFHALNLSRMRPAEAWSYLRIRFSMLNYLLGYRLWNIGHQLRPAPVNWQGKIEKLDYMSDLAADRYRARPIRARIVLMLCKDSMCLPEDISRGWGKFSPEVKVIRLAGSHTTWFEQPHVEEFARELACSLSEGGEPEYFAPLITSGEKHRG